jgi:hypothetical protein
MTTSRRIGDWMQSGAPGKRVIGELVGQRADLPDWLAAELGGSAVAVASVALIRLSELEQTQSPIFEGLVRQLLIAQEADGGWGAAMPTALAIRALSSVPAAAEAVDRAAAHLARQQRPDGHWPAVPHHRMPSEPIATAFVLAQIGRNRQFASKINLEAAIGGLVDARADLPVFQRPLLQIALIRAGTAVAGQARSILSFDSAY